MTPTDLLKNSGQIAYLEIVQSYSTAMTILVVLFAAFVLWGAFFFSRIASTKSTAEDSLTLGRVGISGPNDQILFAAGVISMIMSAFVAKEIIELIYLIKDKKLREILILGLGLSYSLGFCLSYAIATWVPFDAKKTLSKFSTYMAIPRVLVGLFFVAQVNGFQASEQYKALTDESYLQKRNHQEEIINEIPKSNDGII